jgi:hypothetical protein
MSATPPPENPRHAQQLRVERAQFVDQLNHALVGALADAQARVEIAQNALPTPRPTPPPTPPMQAAVGPIQPAGIGLQTPPPSPPANRFQRGPAPPGARTPER